MEVKWIAKGEGEITLNLTSSMAGISSRRALSRGSAPASSGPHSSWSTSRSRGKFAGHLMGRLRHSVPAAVLLSLASVCASCGGLSSNAPPPPPVADSSLGLSSSSISIAQGTASPAVNISVNSINGFTGAVQIAITNPDGETVSLDAAFIAN